MITASAGAHSQRRVLARPHQWLPSETFFGHTCCPLRATCLHVGWLRDEQRPPPRVDDLSSVAL
eukprot:3711905-Prymnesium_polylepis.1